MKRNTSYVFPNISSFNRKGRGGLHKRYQTAKTHCCSFIEVPADFIKNRTEVRLTGKKLGNILCSEDVEKLYEPGTPSKNANYILHTEPSVSRRDGTGTSVKPPLLWNDGKWVLDFVTMTITISKRLGIPPVGIEIHPGGRQNTYVDLIHSIMAIRKKFEKTFKVVPFVVIENRTGQIISNGAQIRDFWNALLLEEPKLRRSVGVVLDIQQLYTVTKDDFLRQLNYIPPESVKGFHIHCRHRTPSMDNEIPWRNVTSWLTRIRHDIFVNPEVHHEVQAIHTISFCNEILKMKNPTTPFQATSA